MLAQFGRRQAGPRFAPAGKLRHFEMQPAVIERAQLARGAGLGCLEHAFQRQDFVEPQPRRAQPC